MIVEQYLSGFHAGDAVGNSTLCFHRFLRGRGIDSRIAALTIDPVLRREAFFWRDLRPEPQAIKIYHFAISSPLSAYFRECRGTKVLLYHNVTPSRFFAGFSEHLQNLTAAARVELEALVASCRHFVADSRFNADELCALGAKDVFVFPVMSDETEYEGAPSRSFAAPFLDGRKSLLFVGRVTPNKKIEDLIKVLSFYKRHFSPPLRLIVAGNTATLPRYYYSLLDLAARLQLGSRDIVFTGHLPREEFLAVYGVADLFLSLSEHEGFCLPLMESCRFGLPVVAYDAGAVAETLGGAGLLLGRKDVAETAALVARVLVDENLHRRLRQAALRRYAAYCQEARPEILLGYLEDL